MAARTVGPVNIVERGSGTPIVLLHGFGVDHRILLPLDDAIAEAGNWRRVYVDLPGMGASPPADVSSTDDMVDVVLDLIDERLGGEPFAVLGNSFGGMLARCVAHRRREVVLGLATIAGVFVATHDERTLPDPVVLHADPDVLASLGEDLADYAELAVMQTPENAARWQASVLPGLRAADPATLTRIAAAYEPSAVPEDAYPAPFEAPSLILTARQDAGVGFADAAERLDHYPRATFVVIDGAGHNVIADRPALVGAHVTDWLARVRGS